MGNGMLRGGCQCGGVRYEVSEKPIDAYVCHCKECQKQSASAFGISVIVPRKSLNLVSGQVKYWNRKTNSGGVLECAFCPDCGSRLWHQGDYFPERISVKGGSLDVSPDLSAVSHIWVSSKLDGVLVPDGASCWDEEPD